MYKVFNKNPFPLTLGTGLSTVTIPAHGEILTDVKPQKQDGLFISDLTPKKAKK